jgi:ParB-like chromosome segregation protein Spo0J
MAKIVTRHPDELRPHPLNKELYGPPGANSAYKDIKASMARGGFDTRHPLLITADGRILAGVTRWACAKAAGLAELPCEVFRPSSEATAEVEAEAKLITENTYRVKSQVTLAREQRRLLELEKPLARARMAEGADGDVSRSEDRVGRVFSVSGKTVRRTLKVLDAMEKAEADGDRRRADRLKELLEAKQTVKALAIVEGKATAKKPPKVDVPRTMLDHAMKAHSEFYEACCKARVRGELDQVKKYLDEMRRAFEAARVRVEEMNEA